MILYVVTSSSLSLLGKSHSELFSRKGAQSSLSSSSFSC